MYLTLHQYDEWWLRLGRFQGTAVASLTSSAALHPLTSVQEADADWRSSIQRAETFFEQHMPPAAKVLELACGTGAE